MRNIVKAIGITAAMAVMIPLSAYAATNGQGDSAAPQVSSGKKVIEWTKKEGGDVLRFERVERTEIASQQMLDLLKLDRKTFQEKIAKGETLADIAKEQGVTREQLKQVLTTDFENRQKEEKEQFVSSLDGMIDSKNDRHMIALKGGIVMMRDFDSVAKLLGLSNEGLKKSLASGKSLADIAKEKGIDVQKVIDTLKADMTAKINEAVKDGKLTQEQADKQLAAAADMIEKMVNGTDFLKGKAVRGPRFQGFPGGPAFNIKTDGPDDHNEEDVTYIINGTKE